MKDKIFSISEAAEHLGVTALTLRNWEAQAKIRAFRTPGGHRRFRKSDLDVIFGNIEDPSVRLKGIIKKLEALNMDNGCQEPLNMIVRELKEII
jgi:excisionase family DNA binding protein